MKVKAFLNKNGKKLMVATIIFGLSISVLTACTHEKTPEPGPEQVTPIVDPEINPGDPGTNPEINPGDPGTNPEVNPGDPGTNPEVNPGDPGTNPEVNPGDPGTNPEINPGDPGTNPEVNPGDPGTNPEVNPGDPGTNPEVNPGDPGTNPEVNPGDTGTTPEVNPQPTELDFSELEEKICQVILSTGRNMTINELISYSIEENKFYMLVDMIRNDTNVVNLYSATIDNLEFETQEDVDGFIANFDKSKLDKTNSGATKTEISFVKSQSDITVNGVTYSKDGIEGDNIFARQCGVNNAEMTYVSSLATQSYADTDTGYARALSIMVLSINESEFIVTARTFGLTSSHGWSDEKIINNLFNEKNLIARVGGREELNQTIKLGVSLKKNYEQNDEQVLPEGGMRILYKECEGCLTITGIEGTIPNELNIPATINGKAVNAIGYGALENCKDLQKIVLPGAIKTIAPFAFAGCSHLNTINIPNGVVSIEDYAFKNCDALISVEIPDSCTCLGRGVFEECDNLRSIRISNFVETINYFAFAYCAKLESVYFGNGIKFIRFRAFCGCSSLENVTIYEGLERIEGETFIDCGGLTAVTIPGSLISIGYFAFENCGNLEEIHYTGDLAGWCNIYPIAGLTKYGRTEKRLYIGGTLLSGHVSIPSGITRLNSTFYNYGLINSISLPSTIERIDDAFVGCGLDSITMSNGNENCFCAGNCIIQKIGGSNGDSYYLMVGCNNSIIPSFVKIIHSYSFSNCSNMTSIVIPNGVKEIWTAAFSGCANLNEIHISQSVSDISESAFRGCYSLTDIYYSGTIQQWNAIRGLKGSISNLNNYTVHCSDGDIVK